MLVLFLEGCWLRLAHNGFGLAVGRAFEKRQPTTEAEQRYKS
jgi:hypothetical protein